MVMVMVVEFLKAVELNCGCGCMRVVHGDGGEDSGGW